MVYVKYNIAQYNQRPTYYWYKKTGRKCWVWEAVPVFIWDYKFPGGKAAG
jgi:hypothetical protein